MWQQMGVVSPLYLPVQCRLLHEDVHGVEEDLAGTPQCPEGVGHAATQLAGGAAAGLGVRQEEVGELGSQPEGHQLRKRQKLGEKEKGK